MIISDLVKDLIVIILDVCDMGFEYVIIKEVLSVYKVDLNFIYKSGVVKKGKIIEICVFYVDICDLMWFVDKY